MLTTDRPTFTTTLGPRTTPIPVQSQECYVCPSWCVLAHKPEDLSDWDTGLWSIAHEGTLHTRTTARGTTMTARLRFVEFVGWSTLPPQANYMGPYVELDADDDSGDAVRHEIDGADVIAWTAVLINLAADATERVSA